MLCIVRVMDFLHTHFNEEQEGSAQTVLSAIAEDVARGELKKYDHAVAIDGPTTKDRDDAINITLGKDKVLLEVFIADPASYIKDGDSLDVAAYDRKSTIYLPKQNYPMIPRQLAEDGLSLNAGKYTPARRVAVEFSKSSGKIIKISYERCLVKAENSTYEEISQKIAAGAPKFVAWSKAAAWLRSIREKNSRHPVLPEYDAESGIMQTEEGKLEYVSHNAVSSYMIVQEAMIFGNHACAILQDKLLKDGVYRGQKKKTNRAEYLTKPQKHISIGLDEYTHATSPNRRYADILVHRNLGALGKEIELDLVRKESQEKKKGAYGKGKLSELMDELNEHNERVKTIYRISRATTGQRWVDKVFPTTDAEKLKNFDPISFSTLLKSAAEQDKINEVFAHEVFRRIKGQGGHKDNYGLVFTKDIINLVRFAPRYSSQTKKLWLEITKESLDKLASDPQKLDEVFSEFINKVGGKFELRQATFISKPNKSVNEPAKYLAYASAIIAEIKDKTYTTKEFIIGFSDRTSATRAKLDFMLSYAEEKLVESAEPVLPSPDKVYTAKKLYLENVNNRRYELLQMGYEITEKNRAFQSKNDDQPRGFKYEIDVIKNGKTVLSVTVKRDNSEEAQRIGLETVLFTLREKGHLKKNEFAHTGLATFKARIKNEAGIEFGDMLVVSPKRTQITDTAAWDKLSRMLQAGFEVKHIDKRRNIEITANTATANLDDIKDYIVASFPRITLIAAKNKLLIKAPPREMHLLVLEHHAGKSR